MLLYWRKPRIQVGILSTILIGRSSIFMTYILILSNIKKVLVQALS
jgi:hypothetical protein